MVSWFWGHWVPYPPSLLRCPSPRDQNIRTSPRDTSGEALKYTELHDSICHHSFIHINIPRMMNNHDHWFYSVSSKEKENRKQAVRWYFLSPKLCFIDCSNNDAPQVREMFLAADLDQDGKLSKEGWVEVLRQAGVTLRQWVLSHVTNITNKHCPSQRYGMIGILVKTSSGVRRLLLSTSIVTWLDHWKNKWKHSCLERRLINSSPL